MSIEREKFEKFLSYDYDTSKYPEGDYISTRTASAWNIWSLAVAYSDIDNVKEVEQSLDLHKVYEALDALYDTAANFCVSGVYLNEEKCNQIVLDNAAHALLALEFEIRRTNNVN